jgi:hypothetical protein
MPVYLVREFELAKDKERRNARTRKKMKRKAIITIMGAIILSTFLNPVMLIRAASPPSIIHVHFSTEYYVNPEGSEGWGQGIILHVTDLDGLDNLFIDDEIFIEILAPDGDLYPKIGDELVVTTMPEEDPPFVHIQWFNPLSVPPVLGLYEITITDNDGLYTTYVTQPTVRVSDTVPTITYPPNFDVILETTPLFTWEAFSPETTWYLLEVVGPDVEWASPHLPPNQLEYRYQGPAALMGLPRGETYNLHLFVNEDEYVGDSEIRRVTSLRTVSFTVFGVDEIYIVEDLLEDFGTEIDALSRDDFKPRYTHGMGWRHIKSQLSNSVELAITRVRFTSGARAGLNPEAGKREAKRIMINVYRTIRRVLIDQSITQQQLLDQVRNIIRILNLYLSIV